MKKNEEELKQENIKQEENGNNSNIESVDEYGDIESIQMQLLGQMAENQELNNRLLRLQADFENFKRRSRQEKDEILQYANGEFLQKLLPVIDNFNRALTSDEQHDDKVMQGFNMIYRQLVELLSKEGLNEIECMGKEFDPNIHDAVMQESHEEFEDNIVIAELQKGYLFKDKLLRPAMVKVCKK